MLHYLRLKFTSHWNKKGFLTYLLLPLTFIFCSIVKIRRALYQKKILSVTHFSIPVIVVGNITVGGTGKTPLVIALAKYLRESGYLPGIVARGYGGHSSVYPLSVEANSDPVQVGDESILLRIRTQCPVVVSPDRVAAVHYLQQYSNCNVIISDDGLQHYRLGRTLEIAVIDGERRFGNGYCLPAGPLREPIARLNQVDFKVCHGGEAKSDECLMTLRPKHLLPLFTSLDGKGRCVAAGEGHHIIHAVAGIGHPQRFFQTLKNLGFNHVVEHIFPDHYRYKSEDLIFGQNVCVIMTEKDAVKCRYFAQEDSDWWYLPVDAQIESLFFKKIIEKII